MIRAALETSLTSFKSSIQVIPEAQFPFNPRIPPQLPSDQRFSTIFSLLLEFQVYIFLIFSFVADGYFNQRDGGWCVKLHCSYRQSGAIWEVTLRQAQKCYSKVRQRFIFTRHYYSKLLALFLFSEILKSAETCGLEFNGAQVRHSGLSLRRSLEGKIAWRTYFLAPSWYLFLFASIFTVFLGCFFLTGNFLRWWFKPLFEEELQQGKRKIKCKIESVKCMLSTLSRNMLASAKFSNLNAVDFSRGYAKHGNNHFVIHSDIFGRFCFVSFRW